jgi:hypothetical protein
MQSVEFYEREARAMGLGTAPGACEVCHCTEDKACAGGCGWATVSGNMRGRRVCTRCVAVALGHSYVDGNLVEGAHPWCCEASMVTTATVRWIAGQGWGVRPFAALRRSTLTLTFVLVRFCPSCGKELPNDLQLHRLWRQLTKKTTRRKRHG